MKPDHPEMIATLKSMIELYQKNGDKMQLQKHEQLLKEAKGE